MPGIYHQAGCCCGCRLDCGEGCSDACTDTEDEYVVDAYSSMSCTWGPLVDTLQPGRYKITYKSGAVSYNNGVDWNKQHTGGCGTMLNGICRFGLREKADTSNYVKCLAPGDWTGFATAAAAEAASQDQAICIDVPCESYLYLWFSDSHAADNIGSVTFGVCPVD
jgi:hypothetical protein